MKKLLVLLFAFGLFFFHSPQKSEAKVFELGLSVGGNYMANFGGGQAPPAQYGLNLELTPSLKFLIVSADLGILYDFLQQQVILRPGVKFFLGWFYFRLAIPVAFNLQQGIQSELLDLGALVGAGARLKLGKFGLFFEANVSPMFLHVNTSGVSMPAELRLGGYFSF